MRRAIHIALALAGAAAVILVSLALKDTRDTLSVPGYEAEAPTDTKFARLARWIPAGSEFVVTVDVSRALANPELRERLMALARSRSGVAAELIQALMGNDGAIGLLAAAGKLGEEGETPRAVVIAQGDFNEEVVLPVVRKVMSEGRAGLSSMDVGWTTIYYESDSRAPFGFMILDGSHMAVGDKASLEAFFSTKPAPTEVPSATYDEVLFGYLELSPRIKRSLPMMSALGDTVYFSSLDGAVMTATLPCTSIAGALRTRMFLNGVRSLVMLQQQNNEPLVDILEGISIDGEGDEVFITTKIAPLMNLWTDDLERRLESEWNDLSSSDVHESPVR